MKTGLVTYIQYIQKQRGWSGGYNADVKLTELVEYEDIEDVNKKYDGRNGKLMVGFTLLSCDGCKPKN